MNLHWLCSPVSLTCQIKIEKSQIHFETQVMRKNFLKLVKRWVMDALKREKKKDKVFLCNDITQVIKVISEISEIYVNLKRQFLT